MGQQSKTSTVQKKINSPLKSDSKIQLKKSLAKLQHLQPPTPFPSMIQAKARSNSTESVQQTAAQGIEGSSQSLPHIGEIQNSFGSHDVSSVQAHVGGNATKANESMGSTAYATGNHVAFKSNPDLHTAAHEAAHVVQQRRGVSLKGGVGQAGDSYELHADAVADKVVAGQSAESMLGSVQNKNSSAIQMENEGETTEEASESGQTPEQEINTAIIAKDTAALTRLATDDETIRTIVVRLINDDRALLASLVTSNTEKWREPAIVIAVENFHGGAIWRLGSTPEAREIIVRESVAQNKAPQLFGVVSTVIDWSSAATDEQYRALIGQLTPPVSGNALFDGIWSLYGDGTNRSGDAARETFRTLYSSRILSPGAEDAWWPSGSTTNADGVTTFDWRWIYEPVTADDDTIKRFISGIRTLPQGAVNTANLAFVNQRKKYWHRTAPTASVGWTASAGTELALTTSYFLSFSNCIAFVSTATGGRSNDVPIGRTTDGTASSVGGSNAPNTPTLTYFLNHSRHEIGHAVGNRLFDGMTETGDQFSKTYGGWATSSKAAFKTAMWTATGSKTVDWTPTGGGAAVNTTAESVGNWMTEMIAIQTEPAGNAITNIPGSVRQKLNIVQSEWGAQKLTTYFNGIYSAAGSLGGVQNGGYKFPDHTPNEPVHCYLTRETPAGFHTFSKAAYDTLRPTLGWYSMGSHKETFAEMFCQKYSGGNLPVTVNSKDPADFFSKLEQSSESSIVPNPPTATTPSGGDSAGTPGGPTPEAVGPDGSEPPPLG